MVERSGIIEKDERWSGEITVTGDIVIPEHVRVTVAAGTVIRFNAPSAWNSDEIAGTLAALNREPWIPEKFDAKRCFILVKGVLTISGAQDDPVTVGNEGWGGGIIFLSEQECAIEHARVMHASYAICSLQKARTRISRSELTRNVIGLFCLGTAVTSVVEKNAVHDNTYGAVLFGSEIENAMDVQITGNSMERNARSGIWFSWVDPAVRGNRIVKNDIGINQVSCRGARIENNEIAENRVGIYGNDVISEEIVNNTIRDNAGEGILLFEKVQSATIAGNTFARNEKAFVCADVGEGAVRDNTVAHGRIGMQFQGHMQGEVSGNTVSDIAETGMECLDAVKLKVTGNTFAGMENGMKIAGAAEIDATGNEIRETQNGIFCAGGSRVKIEKNTLYVKSSGISCVGHAEGSIKDNHIAGPQDGTAPKL